MKPENVEKLNRAIQQAADRIAKHKTPDRAKPIEACDLYILPVPDDDLGLRWLVVRDKMTYPWGLDGDIRTDYTTALVVPIDTFHLVGPADISLEPWTKEPDVARCGLSEWVPKSYLDTKYRVSSIAPSAVADIRRLLYRLARGTIISSPEQNEMADDVEYEINHIRVDRARALLKFMSSGEAWEL
jgi:hypothetical protein